VRCLPRPGASVRVRGSRGSVIWVDDRDPGAAVLGVVLLVKQDGRSAGRVAALADEGGARDEMESLRSLGDAFVGLASVVADVRRVVVVAVDRVELFGHGVSGEVG